MPLMLPKQVAMMDVMSTEMMMVRSDLCNACEDCPSKSQDDY
jgi:hypothetical protein